MYNVIGYNYCGLCLAYQQSFQIADGIDGSAISYTVTYSESTSGSTCGSATIPASSCTNEMCTHLFDTSLSLCPSAVNIDVTVFATNVLGNGSTSEPTFQGSMIDLIICTINLTCNIFTYQME